MGLKQREFGMNNCHAKSGLINLGGRANPTYKTAIELLHFDPNNSRNSNIMNPFRPRKVLLSNAERGIQMESDLLKKLRLQTEKGSELASSRESNCLH